MPLPGRERTCALRAPTAFLVRQNIRTKNAVMGKNKAVQGF
jgi:hypothetical protein